MIYGIGIDFVEIKKMKRIVKHSGTKLARRILSVTEWEIFQYEKYPVRFLAKRFAAKEAVSKAFGIGFSQGITLNQLEIFNDKLGKPVLHLLDNSALLAQELSLTNMHISISDTNVYACAIVVLEY